MSSRAPIRALSPVPRPLQSTSKLSEKGPEQVSLPRFLWGGTGVCVCVLWVWGLIPASLASSLACDLLRFPEHGTLLLPLS